MATQNLPIPRGVWTEVTVPLGMVDDSSYVVEPVGGPGEALGVDGAGAPAADARGHPRFPGTASRRADCRTFPKKAGQTWWWRAAADDVVLVVSAL